MIISASRKTDVPAFFAQEFYAALKKGYIDVTENSGNIKRVSLLKEDVDCIVFWTKNPSPMLEKLDLLEGYPYYFQFTLNPYGAKMEPGTSDKEKITAVFKRLSDRICPDRVVWRYDPVILGGKNDIGWHVREFEKISGSLKGYAKRAVFSFYDAYGKLEQRMKEFDVKKMSQSDMEKIAQGFAEYSLRDGMELRTCAEAVDLQKYGIKRGKCVDDDLVRLINGGNRSFSSGGLRDFCGCAKSVDIGSYKTCVHGCRYCYAC